MSTHITSRRMFLKGGALAAAPVAAAALSAAAVAGSADGSADDGLKARLARLTDEAAIRALHQDWLRQVNAGAAMPPDPAVRRITADEAGAPERIEIAADGLRASGRFDHAVEVEQPMPRDSTLAQMAHAQGHGSVRRSERRLLTIGYRKRGGRWEIEQVGSQGL